jgi:hypothetical protein
MENSSSLRRINLGPDQKRVVFVIGGTGLTKF